MVVFRGVGVVVFFFYIYELVFFWGVYLEVFLNFKKGYRCFGFIFKCIRI